jgi:hypothetical protein
MNRLIAGFFVVFACGPALAAGPGPFLREIATREAVTQADAVRAVAIYLGERQKVDDLTACEDRLVAAGLLRGRFAYQRAEVLRKGFAALLFVKAMGIEGGVSARLFGWGPRSAYKELEFLDMVPPLGERDKMTGAELLALLRLAQERRKEKEKEKEQRR